MCGRYTLQTWDERRGRWRNVRRGDEISETDIRPRFNIAPRQGVLTIFADADGPVLRNMQWGFKPGWYTPKPGQPPPINARCETLLERPMFRGAVAKARCLIPADGFYEWQAIPGQRTKQPMCIRLKDGEPFMFAGLYTWSDAGPSCAIVTCAPNDLMAPIHNRMPVILSPDDEDRWLDPAATDPGAVLSCLRAYPAEAMEAYPVSTLVNRVGQDGPELIDPLPQ